jgi:hypothetical protein
MDWEVVMEQWRFKFPAAPAVFQDETWEVLNGGRLQTVDKTAALVVDHWSNNRPFVQGWSYGVRVDNGEPGMPEPQSKDVWATQVGGDHYCKLPIQPFQYSMKNGLDPMQHTIIKYVTRFRDKNGIQDLEKAKQTIDLLIAYEQEKANEINQAH